MRTHIGSVLFGFIAMMAFAGSSLAADSRTAAVALKAADASDQKVALVIGNSAYAGTAELKNPVNDARAVAKKLRGLGYDVVDAYDVKSADYGKVLGKLRDKLRPGAAAVFYYAGHGLQINNKNYFPGVDAQIERKEDVPFQSLDLAQVFSILDDSQTRLNLVFLDACRNNPYERMRAYGSGGLAKVEAPSGTMISYATRPGSVASDGGGENGLYTAALLHAMDEVNLPIEMLHKRVVSFVKEASNKQQEPWIEGSIEGEFYFRFDPTQKMVDGSGLTAEEMAAIEKIRNTQAAGKAAPAGEKAPSKKRNPSVF